MTRRTFEHYGCRGGTGYYSNAALVRAAFAIMSHYLFVGRIMGFRLYGEHRLGGWFS